MKRLLPCVVMLALAGCGKDPIDDPIGPTGPTGPTNRAPTINSLTVSPGFGIAQVTSFLFSASGSDPDGDSITFFWDFGDGATGTGAAFSKTYFGSGVATVRLTVTDARGLTTTDTRTVTIGSLSGTWSGTLVTTGTLSFTASFTQSGSAVTGTMNLAGFNGRTDPAQPGTISSSGAITLRWKVNPFTDFTFTGQMDATGRRVTGTVAGSGFNGQPFTMNKQ